MINKILCLTIAVMVGFVGCFNIASAFSSATDPNLLKSLEQMKIPVIVINTVEGEEPTCDNVDAPPGMSGAGITNATKVPGAMQMILAGDTLYDSGEYVNKESGLTIKIRGNTSGRMPKKSYKLKLQKKTDLLFRGDKKYKDKDWVLLRSGSSLVTVIGNWAGELIGQDWTPGCTHVNFVMNGEYRGLYVLCEQVTVNQDCRIDVDKNNGYVVEADPYWWNEDVYFPSTLTSDNLKFTYKYPDPEELTPEWHEMVSNDVLAHEAQITDGTYDEVYDCESFAKWLVTWDLLGNSDSSGGNMYIKKKDSESKICMGPLWDFDHALRVEDDWIGLHYRSFYFHHMLNSSNNAFRKAFEYVWQEKGHSLAEGLIERINAFADSPQASDYQRSLDIEDELKFPKDSWQPYLGTLEFMRQYCTDYIARRAAWIDAKMSESTGVEAVEVLPMDTPYMDYDLFGRSVGRDVQGIHIRNGKKINVKK